MTQGSKINYSAKQKRQAKDIETSYEEKGVSEKEAKKRAWATVNKIWGGAKKTKAQTKKTAKKGAVKSTNPSAKKPIANKSTSTTKKAPGRAKKKTTTTTSKRTATKKKTIKNKSSAPSKSRSPNAKK